MYKAHHECPSCLFVFSLQLGLNFHNSFLNFLELFSRLDDVKVIAHITFFSTILSNKTNTKPHNMYALAATTLLFSSTVLAAHHDVSVGPGLKFSPDSISNVAEGDMVQVKFGAGHDIAQSTFAAPCQYMEGGIWSGPSPKDGDVFSFEVKNASAPMWFYCTVSGHCQGGMSLAINPTYVVPSIFTTGCPANRHNRTERTIAAYQSASANAQTSKPQSQEVVGGSIGAEDHDHSDSPSASGSGSASGTASGAASSSTGNDAGSIRVAAGLMAGMMAAGAAFAL